MGALIGGGVDLAFQLIANGGNLSCVNWGDVATSAAIGAVGGGALGKVLTKGVSRGTTVLGKFPDYIKRADELGARRFSVPTDIWNKMSKAEQWRANQKFLDRLIARGDDIVLSNPVKNISETSGAFRKELDYLVEMGFKLSKDGSKMLRR